MRSITAESRNHNIPTAQKAITTDMNHIDPEINEGFSLFKKIFLWILAIGLVLGGITWFANRGVKEVEAGILRYEEFQEIYNTCQKIDADLKIVKTLSENDKMFEQFSKTQRMTTLKSQLNRWIEEYNAKSKMINRSLWKSSELPHQLTTNQFEGYSA